MSSSDQYALSQLHRRADLQANPQAEIRRLTEENRRLRETLLEVHKYLEEIKQLAKEVAAAV